MRVANFKANKREKWDCKKKGRILGIEGKQEKQEKIY